MSTVVEEMAFPLPEEVPQAFDAIINMCVKSLRTAEEREIADWAQKIKDDLSSDEVMTAFEEGFDLSCRTILEELERDSESHQKTRTPTFPSPTHQTASQPLQSNLSTALQHPPNQNTRPRSILPGGPSLRSRCLNPAATPDQSPSATAVRSAPQRPSDPARNRRLGPSHCRTRRHAAPSAPHRGR